MTDWERIVYFIAVAKHGGFSKAAKALYITQPHLSRTIASLEADLGVTLLIRDNKHIELTDVGATLYEEGKIIENQIHALIQKTKAIGNASPDTCHTISIHIGHLAESYSAITISRFANLFPQYPVLSTSSINNYQYSDYTDVIVGFDEDILLPGGIAIRKERDYISISESHPLAKQGFILLSDLAKLKLVILRGVKRHREFEIRVHHDNPNAEFIYVDTVFEMLDTVSLIPDAAVIWSSFQNIRPPAITSLPLEGAERTLKLWVRNKKKTGVTEFVNLFKTIWEV